MDVIQELKRQLEAFVASGSPSMSSEEVDAKVDDLYVEAAMVVATYNMVSRFLLSTDVAGISDTEVPWPVDKKEVSIFRWLLSPLFMTPSSSNIRSRTDDVISIVNFILDYYLLFTVGSEFVKRAAVR